MRGACKKELQMFKKGGGKKKRKAEQVTEKSTACPYKTGMSRCFGVNRAAMPTFQ